MSGRDRHRDSPVEAALAALRHEDAGTAADAEAALDWLIGDLGPEQLSQDQLQTFLWYALPMKFLTDADHNRRIALALGRALDLLGLPRYAAMCSSITTSEVLDAYERSDADGRKAFRRALDSSGIRPPDLDEFEWGAVMGVQEAAAESSVAELLELAIVDRALVPGASGWKSRQQELTRAYLTTSRIELNGRTLLDAIRAERVDSWLGPHRDSARQRILDPIVALVRTATGPPDGMDDPLPSLRWLLSELAGGQPLTQTGNLNRAFVQRAAARFDSEGFLAFSAPRGEHDVYDLQQTRELAQRARLIRRSGRRLMLTAKGHAALADPTLLWRAAAGQLLPAHPFERAVGELTLALLVESAEVTRKTLIAVLGDAVRDGGWRGALTGDVPGEHDISWAYHATVNLLRALSLLAGPTRWDSPYSLSEVGRSLALAALHHRAAGPRSSPLPH